METNVGSVDQSVRTALGAFAGGLSLAVLAGQVGLPMIAAPVLGVIALVALFTAATKSCGVYSVLGVSTCPREAR